MKVSVLIPWRSDGGHRDKAWTWLRERWAAIHPTWEVVVADSPGNWCRGVVANLLVEKASGDVLVMCDADVWVPGLRWAVDEALTKPWVVPHREICRLTQDSTAEVLDQGPGDELWPRAEYIRPPYRVWPGGGAFVMRRELWPGADESMGDGGGWDEGMAIALDSLAGQHTKLAAPLWHLFHPPALRIRRHPEQAAANKARINTYNRLKWNQAAIRALLSGEPTAAVAAEFTSVNRPGGRLTVKTWRQR